MGTKKVDLRRAGTSRQMLPHIVPLPLYLVACNRPPQVEQSGLHIGTTTFTLDHTNLLTAIPTTQKPFVDSLSASSVLRGFFHSLGQQRAIWRSAAPLNGC